MAETFLSFVVEQKLHRVLSLITDEMIMLASNLLVDLRRVQASVVAVVDMIQDAEEQRTRRRLVRLWLIKLKKVAFQAEDVVNEISYEIIQRKVHNSFGGYFFRKKIVFNFELAQKVKNMNELLQMLKNEAMDLGLQWKSSERKLPQLRPEWGDRYDEAGTDIIDLDYLRYLGIDVDDVLGTRDHDVSSFRLQWISSERSRPQLSRGRGYRYGENAANIDLDYMRYLGIDDDDVLRTREDVVARIFSSLTNYNNRQIFTIIPILEIFGTSNLANLVCRKAMEVNIFDVIIWVCPPNLCDERQICRKVLQSLNGTLGGMTNTDLILENLEKKLFSKRFLLVLDDVGEDVSMWWDGLKACMSKISTKNGNAIIVTTCSKQVASIVETPSMRTTTEYSRQRMRNIIYEEDWSATRYSDVMDGLSLMSCLEFCIRFPGIFPIQKSELVQFWIAEGLVESREKGNMCFNGLVHYSVLHDMERNEDDNVVTWKMHGLMFNHILSSTKSENLFKYIDRSIMSYTSRNHSMYDTISMAIPENVASRTLILDGVPIQKLHKLERLRTLVFSNSGDLERLPSSIGRMKHLIHLDVSNTPIRALPKFITKLYNLQTLKFLQCQQLHNIPRKKFNNLINLKNIGFSFEHQMPSGLGKLKGLETLSFFVVGSDMGGSIRELEFLNELSGYMEITRLEEVRDKKEAERANLQRKTKINGLSFQWSYGANNRSRSDEELLECLQPHPNIQKIKIKYYMGKKWPSWMLKTRSPRGVDSFILNNFVGLTLERCWNCIHLPQLGHLPCLKFLTIQHMERVKYIEDELDENINSVDGCLTLFPKLKSLSLSWMESLIEYKYFQRRFHAEKVVIFPCLETLSIQSCAKMTNFPMKDLLALVKVEIKDCKELWFSFGDQQAFPCLRSLSIEGCPKLAHLRNWLLSNMGFNRFRIRRCEWLRFISDDLGLQRSLLSLEISCCKGLIDFTDDILCKLSRLRRLSIGAFSKKLDDFSYLNRINELPWLEELEIWGSDFFGRRMSQLPDQLQCLTNLELLKIRGFTSMEAFPDGLHDLQSLRVLSLNYCWQLEYQSTAATIQQLSCLKHINIYGCRILEENKSKWSTFSRIMNISWSKDDILEEQE